jgi:hypothetical protein
MLFSFFFYEMLKTCHLLGFFFYGLTHFGQSYDNFSEKKDFRRFIQGNRTKNSIELPKVLSSLYE